MAITRDFGIKSKIYLKLHYGSGGVAIHIYIFDELYLARIQDKAGGKFD